MKQSSGTALGIMASIIWSFSALVFSYCALVPTFFLISIITISGFVPFLIKWIIAKENIAHNLKVPLRYVMYPLLGVGLYEFFYFKSLSIAPIAQANLINYLWPILIVLISGLRLKHTTKPRHIIAAMIGFVGIFALNYKDGALNIHEFGYGHIFAIIAAFTWAIYSVETKREGNIPQNALATAMLLLSIVYICLHLTFEPSISNIEPHIFIYAVILGIISSSGYIMWAISMKYGDINLISIFSFFTPIISTVLLIIFGRDVLSSNLIIASALIFTGTIIASPKAIMLFWKKPNK